MEFYFSPNGRIEQPAYWRGVWILFAVSTAVTVLATFVSGIFGFLSLGVMWVWIALHAKRFHDNGKTGWYMLLMILVAAVVGFVLGLFLPALFGFDAAAYNAELESAMGGRGGFAAVMEAMNEAQRATFLPSVLTTAITTGTIGAIMGLFKTDPNDNQYGPGPAGASVAFN